MKPKTPTLGEFAGLARILLGPRGMIFGSHAIVTRYFRPSDQPLTVSNDLPCGRDNMLERRSISPALCAEETRS